MSATGASGHWIGVAVVAMATLARKRTGSPAMSPASAFVIGAVVQIIVVAIVVLFRRTPPLTPTVPPA
ncbi:hypothetical protein FHP25_07470 [Vineibacter terrae]|uniref:Uncharacterized protein n=1 Tax=Vineibacter terrae TaxID=2586908 RepID=A0A5C8PSM3_9HYPH|nr:hypothetical protein [Vineibacter terrae]TXL78825.1 hypothetical protein FHP25_07470 [Vineibacter terrae]